VAIVESSGKIVSAISEERLSRIKNHSGIPIRSIDAILKNFNHEIHHIVIGSDKNIDMRKAKSKLSQISKSPSSKEGEPYPNSVPGFYLPPAKNPRQLIEIAILKSSEKLNRNSDLIWINHHDSHLGQALSVSKSIPSLLISLDGHGDGESGAVSFKKENKITSLARFKDLDSLGELYSAVTNKYNFKPGHHEGKITGLAAYGNYSSAVDVLYRHVSITNGKIEIENLKGLKRILKEKFLPQILKRKFVTSIHSLVDIAEACTENYADLAFAVQEVLEQSVMEIARYWKKETGAKGLSLAGGVFSNVRLNQKLAEELGFESVRVFPNMGDGGISVGGVWSYLSKMGKLENLNNAFNDMYLSPNLPTEDERVLATKNSLIYREILKSELPLEIAIAISNSKLVGIHFGSMEFGPRALGNRSILIDPRFKDINRIANTRLRRTEFMPFAPAVKEENAASWFDFDKIKDLFPFEYMTMTCRVRPEKQTYIPAVVHVDGTARPQIVRQRSNPLYWAIINEFQKITNIPVVINTSFNVHEEPINAKLEDSISALKRRSVDIIFTENGCFQEKLES
jgi:carbamoyltransferase